MDAFEPLAEHGGHTKFAGISVACTHDQSVREDVVFQLTGKVPRLSAIRANKERAIFAVTPARGTSGYLEVITPRQINPEAHQLLKKLAEIVANRITRHRDVRRLMVYERLNTLSETYSDQLTNQSHSVKLGSDWLRLLEIGAHVACESTSAQLAVAYTQSPDMDLVACAAVRNTGNDVEVIDLEGEIEGIRATRSSLMQKAFDERFSIRVLDEYDEVERVEEFDTKLSDGNLTGQLQRLMGEELKSWIVYNVKCDDQPVAMIAVNNKPSERYLPEVLSETDFQLMGSIAEVISRRYANAQVASAMKTRDRSVPPARERRRSRLFAKRSS